MKKYAWLLLCLGTLLWTGCPAPEQAENSTEITADPAAGSDQPDPQINTSGSGPASQPELIGIWRVPVAKVGDRNVSDGLNFFQFNEDGTVDTRSGPGSFASGTYEWDSTKNTITFASGPNSMVYNYVYHRNDGVLRMNTVMDGDVPLNVEAVKTDKLPVREEDEADLKNAFPPNQ